MTIELRRGCWVALQTNVTGVLIRRRKFKHINTQSRIPREDWSDAVTSQGAAGPPELEESRRTTFGDNLPLATP